MKKLSILFGLLLVLGLTVPAMAEVSVYGEITKDKVITVTENVLIDKDIEIDVTIDNILEKVAEADAVINQYNGFNWACENCAEKTSRIWSSILYNTGVVNVNQATGNMNNQGNVVSVAVDVWPVQPPEQPPEQPPTPPTSEGGLAHAQTSATQEMESNEIETHDILWRDAFIIESIIGNEGIVGVNQSTGNINNQLNVVTAAVCLDGVMAIAEADLGQFNPVGEAVQTVYEYSTIKTALTRGSVNFNTGVVGVNQTVGNMANQANIANVAASIRN